MSEAHWIGYGGSAGGGKTDLGLGLAGTKHRRSLILRKLFPSLEGTIERSREIYNASISDRMHDSYNESLHRWRLSSRRHVAFGSVQRDADREKHRGNPHDLYVFDEAPQFSESTVRFIAAWNRTSTPGQLCQVLLNFNPPTSEAERWIIRFFLPWMAYLYPDLPECKSYTGTPAKPGELRWYLMRGETDTEVTEGTPKARSRTFFPASVEDNPIYMEQGYDAVLEALPEPLRSQLRYGSFAAGIEADPWQVIPTAWINESMARWMPGTPDPQTLLSIGLDVNRGGKDLTSVCRLYPDWVAPLETRSVPDGPTAAGLVIRETALCGVHVDVIGVGASAFDFLISNGVRATGVNNAESAPSWMRDRSGRIGFRNVRAASYWAMREALDPSYGARLALPPDPELRQDLASARWSLTSSGILIESKDDIKKRLGRSPDRADAVVLAHYGVISTGTPGV